MTPHPTQGGGMPQVYLIEPAGQPRDALAFVLRDARIPVTVCDGPQDLPRPWPSAARRLVIVDEALLPQLDPIRDHLSDGEATVWALLEPGSFPGLIEALRVGASEIISRDRPARDIVTLVKTELQHKQAPPAADGPGLRVQLAGTGGEFEVHPERLMALLAMMCDDVGRLKRRYDNELEQRRRVEQALMESEAFYQSLVETLPMALFRKDVEGRVTFANQLFCEVLRRSPSDILGRTDYDFFPRDLAEKYRADDRRVMESRQNFEATEQFQTPTGELRYTHVVKTPVYDTNGKLVGIQGVFSDVTDQILAEQALEQERYLLDSLITNSPDNIYFKDFQGRYLRINPAKARRSGLSDPADAIGKSDFEFFPRQHAEAAMTDELRVLQTGEPLLAKEERVIYADGSTAWMSTTKLPLKDRQGRVIGTFGVSYDISPLKHAQEALRQAAEASEAANRAKSDFLANMSHEIRTPLNAVLGMTELVLGTPLTPVQRDYLKLVYESGESLLAVINDILDFSKIEAGHMELEAIPYPVVDTVYDACRLLAVNASKKGLDLVCRVTPDVPARLLGDPGRLRQIVVNLVGNGLKFTEQGGVTVTVSSGLLDDTPALHLAVRDTGIGIRKEKQSTIFEAFRQSDSSITRRFGGTGLGLSISSQLTHLMGGRIWVESEFGQGSTFHVLIPLTPVEETETPTAEAPLAGKQLLVIATHENARKVHVETLVAAGAAVEGVKSPQDAIMAVMWQMNGPKRPQGLVIEVGANDEAALELAERLSSPAMNLRVPIVVVLPAGNIAAIDRCRGLERVMTLTKPAKPREVVAALAKLLASDGGDQTAATTNRAEDQTAGRPLRILLADDSLVNQEVAIGLLELDGHEVTAVDDGQAAVEAWEQGGYEVLLLDVEMPILDGLSATKEIRLREAASGDGAHVPIYAMTAHAIQGYKEVCLDAGMDGYITKPIQPEELRRVLAEVAREIDLLAAVEGT